MTIHPTEQDAPIMTDYVTTAEAAEALQVCKRTVLRMVSRGTLRAHRFNNFGYRINRADVDELANCVGAEQK